MNWPRRQPPAYAPVSLAALKAALRAASGRSADPRPDLSALLRSRYDARVVHLASSGTAALQIAIRLARVRTGDGPVALPAYGCYDIATAAIGADLPIALYDIDPATLSPDLDSLSAVLAGGARVVVIAPIAGIPVDWRDIDECVGAFGALIVEDAAQGHGAYWRGRPLGSLGAISVVSFGRGKGWTGGAGGAVLVRDRVLAEFSRGLTLPAPPASAALHAVTTAAAAASLSHPSRYALPASIPWLHLGETRYREPKAPCAMTVSAASLVLETRAAADDEAAARRANARILLDDLAARAAAAIPIRAVEGARAGYLRLPLRLPLTARDRLVEVAAHLGAAASYPMTLADVPAVRARLRGTGPLPGAMTLARELVTLPTHSLITYPERRALVDAVAEAPRRGARAADIARLALRASTVA